MQRLSVGSFRIVILTYGSLVEFRKGRLSPNPVGNVDLSVGHSQSPIGMEVITMAKKKAAWTVMVYLAGDNNLTTECLFALTEMKKAAPGKEIRVIAQFDPRDDFLPTHRYEINRKGPNSTLFEDIIDEAHYNPKTCEVRFRKESKRADSLATSRAKRRTEIQSILSGATDLTSLEFKDEEITDDTDTGSPVTLYNFLSFCIEEYPADHYMVVLSGHAGGTESDYLLKDESSKGSLTFNELKQVFSELKTDLNGKPIDILGMDNCLMSMGEICYELRGLAQIAVGCESYSPASGWPYRQILQRLGKDFAVPKVAKRKSSAAEAAKAIVEEYVNYYSSYWMAGLSVTQSAIDLGKVDKFRKLVDKVANDLERGLVKEYERNKRKQKSREAGNPFQDALVLAHWEAQSYNGESFVDLYDFCDCLELRLPSDSVGRKCREVKKFIKSEFVLKSCYSGAIYQYSYGVSMYFPWAEVASSYGNLDFIKDSVDTGWGNFLKTYTVMTRRQPRGADDQSRLIKAGLALQEVSADTDRMIKDRKIIDRKIIDRKIIDRKIIDRMGAGGNGNPVFSMRNPPVIFFPTECIRNRRQVLASQERLLR